MKLLSIILYILLNFIYNAELKLFSYDANFEIKNFIKYNESYFLAFSDNYQTLYYMNIINGSLNQTSKFLNFDIKKESTHFYLCTKNYLKTITNETIKNCNFYYYENKKTFFLSIIFPNNQNNLFQLYKITYNKQKLQNKLILNYYIPKINENENNYLNFFSFKIYDDFITIFNNKTSMNVLAINYDNLDNYISINEKYLIQLENYYPFGVFQFNSLDYSLIYGINIDSNKKSNIFLFRIYNRKKNKDLNNNYFPLVSDISIDKNNIYSKSISVKKFNENLLIYSYYKNDQLKSCLYDINQNISFNCYDSKDNFLSGNNYVKIDILIISFNSIGFYIYLNNEYKYIGIIFENCSDYDDLNANLSQKNKNIEINNLTNCQNGFIVYSLFFYNGIVNNNKYNYNNVNDTINIEIDKDKYKYYIFNILNQINNDNYNNIDINIDKYKINCYIKLNCLNDSNNDYYICYKKCPDNYSLKCDEKASNICYNNDNTKGYYYDNKDLCLKKCYDNCEKCSYVNENDENPFCHQCKENFVYKIDRKNKECYNISEEIDYYYYNETNNLFYKCNNTCRKCNNSIDCIECNYTIYDGVEDECYTLNCTDECYTLNCTNGYARKKDYSNRYCYLINQSINYYFYDEKNNYFDNCKKTCKRCNNSNYCTKCNDTSFYIKYEDYLNDYQNKEYDCFDENCFENYASLENNYNNFCYPKNKKIIGFYYDKNEFKFKKCLDNCLICNDKTSCSKCSYNYRYKKEDNENSCISQDEIKSNNNYYYNYCTEKVELKKNKLLNFKFKCKNYEIFFYSYLFWINLCFLFIQLIFYELINNQSFGLTLLFDNLENSLRIDSNYCSEINQSNRNQVNNINIYNENHNYNINNTNNEINNEINNVNNGNVNNLDENNLNNNKLNINRNNNKNSIYIESTINNEINFNNLNNSINENNLNNYRKLSKQNTSLLLYNEINQLTNVEEIQKTKKKYCVEEIQSINNSYSNGSDGSDGFSAQQENDIKEVEEDSEPKIEPEPYIKEGKIKHFKSKFLFFFKKYFFFIRIFKIENFQLMILNFSLLLFFLSLLLFFSMLFYVIKYYSKKISKHYIKKYFLPKYLLCTVCSLLLFHLLKLLLYKKDKKDNLNTNIKYFKLQKKFMHLYFIIIFIFSFFLLYYSITFGLYYKNYQYFVLYDAFISLIISIILLLLFIILITILNYIFN